MPDTEQTYAIKLRAEIARLLDELDYYGDHRPICMSRLREACSCGYDEARRRVIDYREGS